MLVACILSRTILGTTTFTIPVLRGMVTIFVTLSLFTFEILTLASLYVTLIFIVTTLVPKPASDRA